MTARLQLRLPGEWFALDPRDEKASEEQIEQIARTLAGTSDDAPLARRTVRRAFGDVVRAARDAKAEKVLLCREVAGMPIPASITVHAPEGMRMSPAVGTDPKSVIDTLQSSFEELAIEGIDGASRLEIEDAAILRLVTASVEPLDEESPPVHRLRADYWYSVPETKNVLLVSMTTALGDIPNLMSQFFDAVATAAYFTTAD